MTSPAKTGTVRVVGKKGEVRLSPDLCFSKRFQVADIGYYTNGGGSITLVASKSRGQAVYYANERALSGRISLASWLRQLGFSLETLSGKVFKASRQDQSVILDFSVRP